MIRRVISLSDGLQLPWTKL